MSKQLVQCAMRARAKVKGEEVSADIDMYDVSYGDEDEADGVERSPSFAGLQPDEFPPLTPTTVASTPRGVWPGRVAAERKQKQAQKQVKLQVPGMAEPKPKKCFLSRWF